MMALRATARPEALELMHTLEAWGVEVGGAPAIVEALAAGPTAYVDALVHSDEAWRRYYNALQALRAGRCPIELDDATIGALAWTYVLGVKFTREVARRLGSPAPVVH